MEKQNHELIKGITKLMLISDEELYEDKGYDFEATRRTKQLVRPSFSKQ